MARDRKPDDAQANRCLTIRTPVPPGSIPPATRRRTRTCHYCAYGLLDKSRILSDLAAAWPTPMTCFNTPHHPGQMWYTHPTATCRNFRFKRQPPVRLEPPEPPNDAIRYIALTQGRFAIVDAANYDWLNQYKWTAMKTGTMWYARRHSKGASFLMHREIMWPPPGMVVDHINRNGLNNLERNLRVCTPLENQRNQRPIGGSSQYKGVSYDKEHKKWEAGITVKGRRIHIGLFATEIQAAHAYDQKARELFGPFAYLNFPNESTADQ